MKFTTVFLSSTAKDLQPWRNAVHAAIGRISGVHCVRMEDFGAIDATPLEACLRKVAECDLFVGLVGHLHGSRPEGNEASYTQLEYELAKHEGKPRLMFLADEDFPLPARLGRESESMYQRQIDFRNEVRRELTIVAFHEPDKLAALVMAALQNHFEYVRQKKSLLPKGGRQKPAKVSASVELEGGVLVDAYLGNLLAKTEHLTLLGIDPAVKDSAYDPRLKLKRIYTAQRALPSFEQEERVEGETEDSERENEPERVPVSVLKLLNREGWLVLLGDPGSGKSTFVNFVTSCLAGERLGRLDLNLATLFEKETALTQDISGTAREGWERNKKIPWQVRSPLPVRFVLRDLTSRGHLPGPGKTADAIVLWDFLRSELQGSGCPEYFPYLRKELLAGRCLVLFDGLDEVPELQRYQVLRAIEAWVNSIRRSPVLVTSRMYAYQKNDWKLSGFAEATLAPFNHDQIGLFIDLWYEQMMTRGRLSHSEARGGAELLRRAIFGSDRLLALAERPLLLTLTASLHAWGGGALPERREELLRHAVELLLNTWERRRVQLNEEGSPSVLEPSLAEWLRIDREEVRLILEEVAFEAHRGQHGLAGTADIAERDLAAKLLHLKRNPDAHPGQLVAYLRDRSGLLIERGHGIFTLPHRAFQEYLAACYLAGGSDPEEIAELARSDPQRWREVVLLVGAKGSKASVWNLAESLCDHEPGGEDSPKAHEWGTLLAGSVLAESANLKRVSAVNQAKLDRLRYRLLGLMKTESIPVVERAAAGKVLGTLGDPRFEVGHHIKISLESLHLGFLEVPEGMFQMGSDPNVDPDSLDEERPHHQVDLQTYWLARYPVTIRQFAEFVAGTGYSPEGSLWRDGALNQPVTNVSWFDALAYCHWIGGQLREEMAVLGDSDRKLSLFRMALCSGKLQATLPSEAEWEKAARGVESLIYPWGRESDPNRANYRHTGLDQRSSVGCFAGATSPFGHEEMVGNVWEWTRSMGSQEGRYPYVPQDGRENLEDRLAIPRTLRGGAFYDHPRDVRCASRGWKNPSIRDDNVGFRVALSPLST